MKASETLRGRPQLLTPNPSLLAQAGAARNLSEVFYTVTKTIRSHIFV